MLFRRGIHPEENKLTETSPIVKVDPPPRLILFLKQHIGKPSLPIVKQGDKIKAFQKIAVADGEISSCLHSPMDGVVIAIGPAPHPGGTDETAIIIETKGMQEFKKEDLPESKTIIQRIADAGIVGLGGAMFPTHAKLCIPEGKRIDTLVINGGECEPFLTSDSRIMQEHPKETAQGIRYLMKALSAEKAIIGIEDNKKEAIVAMKKACDGIDVMTLPARYPQGAEKILIRSLTGREVPAGGLPLDVGIVVCNVATAFAVYEAVALGKPLVERVVTVTGDVKEPKNILAPIGTPYEHLIAACGGYVGMPKKIICGGPMMGLTQHTDKTATIKGNNGIVVLNDRREETLIPDGEDACIRCGRCVDVCPMKLAPTTIMRYSRKGHYGFAKANYALDCFECGCCSYVCPQGIDIVGWIKIAKAESCKR